MLIIDEMTRRASILNFRKAVMKLNLLVMCLQARETFAPKALRVGALPSIVNSALISFGLVVGLSALAGPPVPPGLGLTNEPEPVLTNKGPAVVILPVQKTTNEIQFVWNPQPAYYPNRFSRNTNAVWYRIFRSTNLLTWEHVDDVLETNWTDTIVSPGVYFWRVAATQDLPAP